MQKSCHDGLCIEFPVGADFGDCQRMGDIGLAGLANLSQMLFVGKTEGFQNPLHVGRRNVFFQFLRQVGKSDDFRSGKSRYDHIPAFLRQGR